MCKITAFRCPECSEVAQHGFLPCNDIVQSKMNHEHSRQSLAEPSVRIHCPTLFWPPAESSRMISQFCDHCASRHLQDAPTRVEGPKMNKEKVDRNGTSTTVSKEMVIDNSWSARLSEESQRVLTLRIPYCYLCGTPSFISEEITGLSLERPKFGIKDVEMEFNSTLWKWTWLGQGREAISLRLATGFITKPCSTCHHRETLLREKVHTFIRNCRPVEA
ncbi:uncharacterized protein F4812DRAFT_124569 [Daldinia caldariorum]|uniref:uncharacterized protein n=1 Tax=Daldinia caldariorum TaxID=326644 RepID=UPI002007DDB7|nr:uncharacterized protein F4812DRAFT_124569 [Daldinia caldariorum]KAI1465464.1 hypothetical protein F4812DRAFT_124569 [Daldinia caldariorum]